MATINGTAASETLKGTSGNDRIVTSDGNDQVEAGDGDDEVNGYLSNPTTGQYTFYPAKGSKTIYGGNGADFLIGGSDNDTIYGEDGPDTLYGHEGNDLLDGGPGNDQLGAQSGGNDTLLGGAGNDRLNGYTGTGDKLLDGGVGNDTIDGGTGNDTLTGDEGLDSLSGGDGNDSISGGADNDTLNAGAGQDTLLGGAGNDVLFSRTTDMASAFDDGANLMDGGDGDDSAYGGLGNDTLIGGAGNDLLDSKAGNDSLDGGDGNDRLASDDGNDSLSGGAGNDTLNAGAGQDTLLGGAGNDTLFSRTTDMAAAFDDGANLMDGGDGDDSAYGGLGNDTLIGGTGNDLLDSKAGNDSLDGGDGNDSLVSDDGNDLLSGGAGDDTLSAGAGLDTLLGGAGNDSLFSRTTDMAAAFDDGANLMDGEDGNDLLVGGLGHDTLLGGAGDDSLYGGGDGDDSLYGGEGADSLFGGIGNDTLGGGGGINWLDGFSGDDTYQVTNDTTVVTDSAGVDTAYVTANFVKMPSSIENVVYQAGAVRLPYWIDALLPDEAAGHAFKQLLGSTQTYLYAFPSALPAYDKSADHALGYAPFTLVQMARTREALAYVSSVTGLSFVETRDPAQANTLAFANNRQTGSAGYANYPSTNLVGGDLFLNIDEATNVLLAEGSYGALTLIHELGHALGLEHPFSAPDGDGDVADAPHLGGQEDSTFWTVMSYTRDSAHFSLQFRDLDIAALQYLYGPSKAQRTGDDTYRVDARQPNFIWDGNGTDTLSVADAQQGATVHLTSGYWGFVGAKKAEYITAPGQITVNFGTVIENLIGSAFADRLVGNEVANRIEGGAGADTIEGGAGDDSIVGGDGLDTVVFMGPRKHYIVIWTANATAVTVTSTAEGYDTLTSIETLTFSDGSYAASAFISNTAPTLTSVSALTGATEDTAYPITWSTLAAAANEADAQGDAIAFSVRSVSNGTLTKNGVVVVPGSTSVAEGETLIWTPASNANGTLAAFSIRAVDGTLTSANDVQVSVAVAEVNDSPSASNVTGSTNEDAALTSTLPAATDADGNAVTYTKATNPSNGTATVTTGGSYTYTPTANYNGPDSFTYTVSDGQGGTNTYAVNLTVNAVNDAPVVTGGSASTTEDIQATGTLSATDVDNANLSYSVVRQPANGNVTLGANGSYAYTPAANFNGADSFTFRVSDGALSSNTATISITVAAVNDTPVVATPLADQSVTLGSSLNFTFGASAFTDVETTSLTYSASRADGTNLPAWLTFNAATRSFSGTPAQADIGTVILKVTASDGSLSATDAFDIAIKDSPIPIALSFSPLDGAKSVPVGSNLLITFNKPIQLGIGPITLKAAGGAVLETFTAENSRVSGNTLTLDPKADLSIFTNYVIGLGEGAVKDTTGIGNLADSRYDFKTATVDGLYHFCVVAFGVAPGATYMADLAEAWNYGLTLRQIVDIFTTKSFFLDLYPANLSNQELATRLVQNIVKSSAPEPTRTEGISDIQAALDYGLSRGEVIYNVFGNLATRPLTDPAWAAKWGGTAKQFQNQLTVARHLTEVLEVKTTDMSWLRAAAMSRTLLNG